MNRALDDQSEPRRRAWVDLASFANPEYDPGRGLLVRAIWFLTSLLFFECGWFAFPRPKPAILRLFGAKIGRRVVIKPHVRIKYPWRLAIGDHCWIGQGCWIDNIGDVHIGSDVCVSQGAYLCTGSHDYRKKTFDLIVGQIDVEDGAWIAAQSILLGRIRVGANALVAAGSVVTADVPDEMMVGGNPAKPIKRRPVI